MLAAHPPSPLSISIPQEKMILWACSFVLFVLGLSVNTYHAHFGKTKAERLREACYGAGAGAGAGEGAACERLPQVLHLLERARTFCKSWIWAFFLALVGYAALLSFQAVRNRTRNALTHVLETGVGGGDDNDDEDEVVKDTVERDASNEAWPTVEQMTRTPRKTVRREGAAAAASFFHSADTRSNSSRGGDVYRGSANLGSGADGGYEIEDEYASGGNGGSGSSAAATPAGRVVSGAGATATAAAAPATPSSVSARRRQSSSRPR
jgi:hypothetical protein